jgi:hypothetical protein
MEELKASIIILQGGRTEYGRQLEYEEEGENDSAHDSVE